MRRPFWLFSFTCRRPTGYTIFWQLYLKEYLLCVLLDPTLDGKYYSLALKWEIFYNSCSTVHLDLHRSLRCSRWGILWNKISTLTLPRSIWFLFSWTTSISYFLSTLCSYNKIRIKAAAHNRNTLSSTHRPWRICLVFLTVMLPPGHEWSGSNGLWSPSSCSWWADHKRQDGTLINGQRSVTQEHHNERRKGAQGLTVRPLGSS